MHITPDQEARYVAERRAGRRPSAAARAAGILPQRPARQARERAVPCGACGTPTLYLNARCAAHGGDELGSYEW